MYHNNLAIRQGFPSLDRLQITKAVLCNFALLLQVLPFLNNLKALDPSYKMDLDGSYQMDLVLWDCF